MVLRVLHIIGSLDPTCGGPPIIAASLAAAQAGLGLEVTLATMSDPRRRPAVTQTLAGIPGTDRVRLVELPQAQGVERIFANQSRRALRPLIEQSDVVHLHSIWESVLRVAAIEARRLRRPYFILLNGMLDPFSLSQSRWKKRLALALGYRRMLNGAAGLHLGNADEQRLIEPLNLRTPGVICPNGIFEDQINPLPAKGKFRAAHPELGEEPFVLFLSRLHYKKGLDYLAEGFIQLSKVNANAHLVVAGPDGGARKEFEQRIAQAGLSPRTHVIGPLYGAAKFEALVDADLFCLPSRQEGFSMAITEALATGAPVICTPGCHFPEVAQAGAGMVVEPNPEVLAHALQRLLDDEALRDRMGQAGRKLVLSRFTWPNIAQRMIGYYKQAVTTDASH